MNINHWLYTWVQWTQPTQVSIMPEKSAPDWEFKDRDIAILQERARNPQISSRQLADILNEEYAIDVSHVTVSESIRKMREVGVYREAIVPNEEYYHFSLFEFQLNGTNFAEGWRDALEYIRNDKHTLFYFLTDGEYQWKSIMMFSDAETESKLIHEFYKKHGKVISNLSNSVATNVLKFGANPDIFKSLEWQGKQLLLSFINIPRNKWQYSILNLILELLQSLLNL